MASRPEMSLIIATLGRPAELRAALDSLAACDPTAGEVVVVDAGPDDGSTRASLAAFAERAGGVRVTYLSTPPGSSSQRNTGLRAATGDVVAFADDDVLFEPATFAALGEAFGDPAVIGATGRILEARPRRVGADASPLRRLLPGGGHQGTMTSYGYPVRIRDRGRARDVQFMSGCLMSARRDAAMCIGFDEALEDQGPYALAEDEDFSYRLSRLGRLRYVPDARVVHHRMGVGSSDPRAFNRMVVLHRTYLFRKNFARTPLARVQFAGLIVVLILHRAVNAEWRAILGLVEGAARAWRDRPRRIRNIGR